MQPTTTSNQDALKDIMLALEASHLKKDTNYYLHGRRGESGCFEELQALPHKLPVANFELIGDGRTLREYLESQGVQKSDLESGRPLTLSFSPLGEFKGIAEAANASHPDSDNGAAQTG